MHQSIQAYTNFSSGAMWRSRRIYLVGALGTIIEWYDFALYGCFAHVLAKVFFVDQHSSLLMVYAIFFISYLARPVGGLFYGLVGDYLGRKPALLISIFMITLCMFFIAILPSWQRVGALSSFCLVVVRIVQGLSVGGETAGALVYVLESVDNKCQGRYGSVTWAMAWLGGFIASIIAILLMYFFEPAQLIAWGWRLAYLLGGFAGLIIFIMRVTIPESIEYDLEKQRLMKQNSLSNNNQFLLKEVLANYKLPVVQIIALLGFSAGITSSIYTYFSNTYFPIYFHQYFSISLLTGATLHIIMELLAIMFLIFFGVLSDRVDRKRLLMMAAACFLFFSYPLLSLLSTSQWRLATIILLLFGVTLSMYGGPLPALLVRLAPLRVRYTVFALGYNIAFAVFGGSAPLICSLLAQKSALALAFYFMALAVLALIALCSIGKRPVAVAVQPVLE